MKTLFLVSLFILISTFAFSQESPDDGDTLTTIKRSKFFIATNSGLKNTPFGLRIGLFDKVGGYIGTRFGSGHKYKENKILTSVKVTKTTLFGANAGFIFPIATQRAFKVHTFLGLGYGNWFDRLSKSGQTLGVDFEGGLILSYHKFMVNFGGNILMGDGNSPKSDINAGIGFKL
jgi:hypothetical protein